MDERSIFGKQFGNESNFAHGFGPVEKLQLAQWGVFVLVSEWNKRRATECNAGWWRADNPDCCSTFGVRGTALGNLSCGWRTAHWIEFLSLGAGGVSWKTLLEGAVCVASSTDSSCQSDRGALTWFRCVGTHKCRALTACGSRKLIGLNNCFDFALIFAASKDPFLNLFF